MFLVAFFSFFRCSEFVPSLVHDPSLHLPSSASSGAPNSFLPLTEHPDQAFVQFLVTGFSYGFHPGLVTVPSESTICGPTIGPALHLKLLLSNHVIFHPDFQSGLSQDFRRLKKKGTRFHCADNKSTPFKLSFVQPVHRRKATPCLNHDPNITGPQGMKISYYLKFSSRTTLLPAATPT
ncbi:hypothetical protein WMY93_011286 [Mugilogobius chulae]|uniref:Uncharacterized protein n=1 Tax=Mugilogobius chulae TaxID=88201 RepID=A0AAW0P3J3_9GOBI